MSKSKAHGTKNALVPVPSKFKPSASIHLNTGKKFTDTATFMHMLANGVHEYKIMKHFNITRKEYRLIKNMVFRSLTKLVMRETISAYTEYRILQLENVNKLRKMLKKEGLKTSTELKIIRVISDIEERLLKTGIEMGVFGVDLSRGKKVPDESEDSKKLKGELNDDVLTALENEGGGEETGDTEEVPGDRNPQQRKTSPVFVARSGR